MKRLASAAGVLAATFAWLAALFAVQPFDRANAALDRAFGAPPAWTQVATRFYDPTTQEMSRGEHPLASFRILSESWAAHPGAVRIILMGNSQTQTVSLAPGEPPPAGPEKTYPDLIAESYRQAGSQKVFYRLSAGALSYQEMLWYATYLALQPEIKPDVVLVQLNYPNFANAGIRAGMLEMLSDARFRQAIEELSDRDRPDAVAFVGALRLYQETQRTAGQPTANAPGASRGYRLETAFRERLDKIPGFDRRDALRATFSYMLSRCRLYLLRLDPSKRRSIAGARVDASRAALEDLLELCHRSAIRVILFHAPTNPAVPLYATREDDRSYHAFAASLASRFGVPALDFEHSIPASAWGMELNVPDPLHLSRQGHRTLAGLMLASLGQNGL